MENRYYIAVPKKIKNWSYQTIPTWKNYSYTGTLEKAQMKAIELFVNEGNLDYDEILESLSEYHNPEIYNEIYENWDNFSEEKKYEYCKEFYKDYLEFEIDDFNKGLTLWDQVSNDSKKNIFNDELNVIELD